MTVFPIQSIFNRGELTSVLHSRIDLEYFKMAYKYGENFVVTRHGGLMNRPGTKFLGTVKDQSKKTRTVKFIFSRTQIYVIEFGHNYVRFWANDGQVVSATAPVVSISKANPGVVGYSGADVFANGDNVIISGAQGMTEINGIEAIVGGLNTGANTFNMTGLDTTGFGTWTAGGIISKIYEVATTYTEAELPDLQFAQSNDVIYIAHKSHAPAKLQRFAETNWTLSNVVFIDGPYLPSPSGSQAAVVLSTNGGPSAPTSVTDVEAGTSPTVLFDNNENTAIALGAVPNTIRYKYAAAKTLNSYIIVNGQNSSAYDLRSAKNWIVRGSNDSGATWTILDARSNEIGWQKGEARYYQFFNEDAYLWYDIKFSNSNAQANTLELAEIYWGQNGDFATAITATFSNVNGINNGIGFQSTDVGRAIRLFSSNDAKWRYFVITVVTDTTHVSGRFYGYSLRQDYNISEWQLGAFSVQSGWPAAVAFYNDRLVWARTTTKPLGVYASGIGAYENFSVSVPIVDDDSITINITSSKTEEIIWMVEGTVDLIIGTSIAVRTLGKGESGKAFSPTNFQVTKQTSNGSANVTPSLAGSTLIYPSYHLKSLREFLFSFEVDAYVSPEVSILSDQLLKSGIVYMDYANDPEPILWIVNGNGEYIGLTYDKENKVVGLHRHRIAGVTATNSVYSKLETLCTVPGNGQDDTWMVVQRQINGVTKRYMERVTKYNDENVPKEDAWYLDCALEYNGTAANVFSGLNHLIGQTVTVYANNTHYAGLVVTAAGKVTLPGGATATRALIGLQQSQYFDLLQPVMETPDGISFNRKKHSVKMLIDLFRTKGLRVGNVRAPEAVQYSVNGSKTENPEELQTCFAKVHFDSRWDDQAGVRILQDKPYPAFIRSVMLVNDGEP